MTIEFAAPPRPLWISDESHLPPNRIRIEAKPDSFTALTWLRKSPGDQMLAEPITLAPPPELRGDIGPEPYELLIEEAMAGDPTLFAREDSIEESWRIVEPILTDYPKVRRVRPRHAGDPPAARDAGAAATGYWPEEPPGVTAEVDLAATGLGAAPRRHRLERRRAATPDAPTCPLDARGEAQARRLGRLLDGRPFALGAGQPAGPGPADLRAGRLRRPGRGRATTCWSGTTATTRA